MSLHKFERTSRPLRLGWLNANAFRTSFALGTKEMGRDCTEARGNPSISCPQVLPNLQPVGNQTLRPR